VIATLNGAVSIAGTVAACARQADTFVVSDGSTDDIVGVVLSLFGAIRRRLGRGPAATTS
jgi:hypothetical protein